MENEIREEILLRDVYFMNADKAESRNRPKRGEGCMGSLYIKESNVSLKVGFMDGKRNIFETDSIERIYMKRRPLSYKLIIAGLTGIYLIIVFLFRQEWMLVPVACVLGTAGCGFIFYVDNRELVVLEYRKYGGFHRYYFDYMDIRRQEAIMDALVKIKERQEALRNRI